MIWHSWGDFIAMGGYAPYVWGSVGAAFALVGGEVAALRVRARSARRALNVHGGQA